MKPILLVAITLASAPCFAQSQAPCFNVPVTLSGNTTKEVSVTADATKSSTNCTYVYYHRRRDHKRPLADKYSDLTDAHASTPILISKTKDMQPRTQSYKVTVNSPDATVTACPNSALNLQADINVEKESEFTGFYPVENKDYNLVSRRVYMKTKRKMYKAMRAENKVARLTGTCDM